MELMNSLERTKAAIGALVLVVAGAAYAQIPVTDVASISTSISNQVESIAKWTQQFSQMQHYQKESAAITGSRGVWELVDRTALKTTLTVDWQQFLTDVKSTSGYITEHGKLPTLMDLQKPTPCMT